MTTTAHPTTTPISELHLRYLQAAQVVAINVSVQRKIDTDPSYPCDRSPRAVRLRAENDAADLATFERLQAEFNRSIA